MYNFGQNVVKAARNLIKAPGFTLIAVLTLGLGIGVITAVFSVAHGILVRSLPFADPDAIVMVWENNPRLKLGVDKLPAAPADFIDWREQNKSFQDMATFSTFSFSLTDGEIPEKIDAVLCSASFFSVLGSPAAKGRVFAPGEDKEGNNHVAVISDNLWRRRFGADPNMIGKSLTLTGKKYEVIGIMPPGFDFPQNSSVPDLGFTAQTDLWIPLVFDEDAAKDRRTLSLPVIARLKPGVTLPQAQADMSAIAANIDQQYKKSAGFGTTVMELREQMVGEFQKAGARSPGLLFAQAVDSLQFDSDGRVANAAAMVEKLKREFPEQFGRDVPPSIDAGAGRNSSVSHLTKDTLSRMKPAEVARLDWSEVKRVLSEK